MFQFLHSSAKISCRKITVFKRHEKESRPNTNL